MIRGKRFGHLLAISEIVHLLILVTYLEPLAVCIDKLRSEAQRY